MKFKDGRITVSSHLTKEDYAKYLEKEYAQNKPKRIACAVLTLLCIAVAVMFAFDEDNDIVLRILDTLRFSLIALFPGAYWYILSRKGNPDEAAEGAVTFHFCRKGFFIGRLAPRKFVPYRNITRCTETTDLIFIDWKYEDGIKHSSCISSRFVSRRTAELILPLLREKCGRKYRFKSRFTPADAPETVGHPCPADSPVLYELSYMPTAEEVSRAAQLFNRQRFAAIDKNGKKIFWLSLLLAALFGAIALATAADRNESFYLFVLLAVFFLAMAACCPYGAKRQKQLIADETREDAVTGVRIALYNWAAIFRVGGDEFVIHYTPALTVEKTDEFTAVHLNEAGFGTYCAIPNRVLSEHPQFIDLLESRIPSGRTRQHPDNSEPLRDFSDTRGRDIISAQYGRHDVRIHRHRRRYELVVDGKVYAEHKGKPYFAVIATVEGTIFAAVRAANEPLRIYADRAEIAREVLTF